jgi:GPH family glycoside/pentoside/hexuronide:cation symporter
METSANVGVPADRISLKEKVGYALGDSASNLYWKTFEFFLVIFYTDVFGISAAAVGTMLLVTRVTDAVTDPIVGAVADRTRSRWGHFRPYLLWGALPMAVAGVLTFTTPDLTGTPKIIYAYVTYGLLMLAYTAVNIPYTALMGVMTPNSIERTALASLRFIGAFTAAAFVQFFTLDLVHRLGQGNDQRGWQLTMVLYGVLAVMMFMLCFSATRERIAPPEQQQTDLVRDLRDLFGSRPWCVIFVVLLLLLGAFSVRAGATAFYFKYYVDVAPLVDWLSRTLHAYPTLLRWLLRWAATWQALLALFLVSNGIFGLLGVALTPRVVRWFGKKRTFILAVGLGGFSYMLLWLPGPTDIGSMFALQIASSFILAFNSPIVFAMFADTADSSEWRTGRRATGLVFASALFGQKLGWALGGWLVAVMLAAFGYVANVDQSPTAISGILLAISVVPGAMLVAAAGFMRLYVLDDQAMVAIERELEERRQSGTTVETKAVGRLLGPALVGVGFVALVASQFGVALAGWVALVAVVAGGATMLIRARN